MEAFLKDNALVLSELKDKHKNLFLINTSDGFFVFRPMTKGEFSGYSNFSGVSEADIEEKIFSRNVVYPEIPVESYCDLYCGTITSVAKAIIDVSGFNDENIFISLLNVSRDKMDTAENKIIEILFKAFPCITLEEINNLDIEQLSYRLALAEKITGVSLSFQKIEQKKPSGKPVIDFNKENREIMSGNPEDTKSFLW